MQEFTPWLGICHLRQVADDSPDTQPTLAAVWADSVESFEREMHVHTNSHGLQMIWAEGVVVADEWLAKHPDRKDGQRLVDKVSAKHLVEIGGFGAGATGLGADGLLDGDTEGYLHIEEIEVSSLPDQSGLPFWEQDWIAPDLKALLFGQDDDSKEPLRTYFIVDATLRKNITGVFDLDTLDVLVRCLFKGEAVETMKEAAPYLLDVTLPDGAWEDNDLVPAFHKSFFDKHWGQNTGIFVRTTASMDEVWGHFRRFTKVQVEEDKRWVYLRFWDPRIAPFYFGHIKGVPEKVAQWVKMRDTTVISTIIGNVEQAYFAWVMSPNLKKLDGMSGVGVPMLSSMEVEGFKDYRIDLFANQLVAHFEEKDSHHAALIGDEALKKIVLMGIERAKKYGITRGSPVKLYVHLMLGLGASFDKDPMLPWASSILTTEINSYEQAKKVNKLRENLLAYLKDINGRKGEHLKVFSDALQLKISNLHEDESIRSTSEFLAKAYPAKARYIGSDMLNNLIGHTAELCQTYGLHKGRSIFIISCLRFVYGVGVIDDPQYSWLGKIMEKDTEEVSKDDLLHKMFVKFISKVDVHVRGAA